VLEAVEEALDVVSQGIGRLAERTLDFVIGPGRDHGIVGAALQIVADDATVFALVGASIAAGSGASSCSGVLRRPDRRLDRMSGTDPWRDPAHPSGMNFGRESAARTANSISQDPLFRRRHADALGMVLSII
jgi:hypothetical protein